MGGIGALLATALIVAGGIKLLRIEEEVTAQGFAFILCGVSFIWGMFYFGIKRASDKDENPED